MDEKKKECSNTHNCTCPKKDCPRHGTCCDCVAYHQKLGSPPNCIKKA